MKTHIHIQGMLRITACGAWNGCLKTLNPAHVTCKRCLAYLAKHPTPKQ